LKSYIKVPGVNSALNIMSIVDIIQDIAGIAFGVAIDFSPIVVVSGFMLFLDVYAIYLVALEDPFLLISFPSTYDLIPTLERISFIGIMVFDTLYDGAIMTCFLFISWMFNTNVNGLWWGLFAFTAFTFGLDIY